MSLQIMLSDPVLVVVDMQKDFCKPGYAFLEEENPKIESATETTGEFLANYRNTGRNPIIVRTTHDENTNSIVLEQRYKSPDFEGSTIPCQTGTEGADLVPELNVSEDDIIIEKHRYSAFHNTPLDLYLSSNDVTEILVAGVKSNVCVTATMIDAFMHGYQPTLLADCTASSDEESLEKANLENINRYFGNVMQSDKIEL